MASLNITECENIVGDASGIAIAAFQAPSLAVQDIDFTSGEQQSAAFNNKVRFIRIRADADCKYLVGANPSIGSAAATKIGAGQIEFVGVKKGWKIAVKS